MKKRILSVLMLSMMALGMVSAQTETVTVENADGSKDITTYSFNPHWFIQLQGGAQETLGETKFMDLVSPTAQIELGYQFSPVWALRLGVNAWQSKGGWGEKYQAAFNLPKKTYKWNYVAPAVDVKFNIINAIAGWKKDRVFSMNLIAGAGVNFAGSLDDADPIRAAFRENAVSPIVGSTEDIAMSHYRSSSSMMPFGRFGLDLDFAVSQRVSLGIEGLAHVLSDHYNGKHTNNADWYFNVVAGVKIALGKTVKQTVEHIDAPAPVVIEEPVKEPEPVVEVIEPYQCNVFFKINKTVAEEQERAKVAELAAYMVKYPDCKVTLTGYADKGTGNAKINLRLSEGRVNYVANLLRSEYNIDADRIYTEFKGDTEQPFADNDSNRVTVCLTK